MLINDSIAPGVTVYVKGREEDLGGLTQGNFNVSLDFGKIEEQGEKKVKLDLSVIDAKNISVLRMEPEEIDLSVESITANQFAVSPIWEGEPAEGYELTSSSIFPRTQRIRGRESLVNQAAGVELRVDLSDLAGNRTMYLQSKVIDGDGEPMPVIDWEQSVEVSLEISKEVPVQPAITGNAAEDYYMLDCTATPATVFVNGTKEALEGVDSIFTELIDITSARQSMSLSKLLVLPSGVSLTASKNPQSQAQIDIAIERYEYRRFDISRSNIQLINAREDSRYKYEIVQSEIPIILKGKTSDLNAVAPDMITAVASVTDLNTGLHHVGVVVTLPDGVVGVQDAFQDVLVSADKQGHSGESSGAGPPPAEAGGADQGAGAEAGGADQGTDQGAGADAGAEAGATAEGAGAGAATDGAGGAGGADGAGA
jgi:YbbR domain-containing protein